MATTTRLSLRYPTLTDTADVPRDIGNLANDIDNAAIFSKGTFANRPSSTVGSPGIDGRYYLATDTSRLYLDTGTSWVEVASGADSVTSTMIVNASITDAKFASALANALGISNGGDTRRATTVATTERTNTSTSWVDITGCSVSVSVATNSVTTVQCSFDIRGTVNAAGHHGVRLLANSSPVGAVVGSVALGEAVLVETNLASSNVYGFTVPVHSAISGTGTQTFKLQTRTSNASNTGYIKNVYLTATNSLYS